MAAHEAPWMLAQHERVTPVFRRKRQHASKAADRIINAFDTGEQRAVDLNV